MLPASYQIPAAIVLLLGGIVGCFFGYRLFRIVLAITGFIVGAGLASSIFGMSDTWPMIAAAVIGGLIGAAILFFAYYAGVALTGAVLGAVVANVAFAAGDRAPSVMVVIALAVIGAALAMYLQRYFIIVGTAFGGAWTMIVGAMALLGDRQALQAAASNDVWVFYPLDPAPGRGWIPIAWIVLGLLGAAVQVGITGGEKGRVVRRKKR
ncbi:MAG: DUF4203 domain-containing protein [Vicinamibacterales bacterium]